jgi:dihydroorotase
VETLRDLGERIGREARVRVLPIAAITRGRRGEEPVDFAGLAGVGAIGFSDDGVSTRSSAAMRAALEASRALDRPIMVHCEDPDLARGGAMHEGEVSRSLGIRGIPAEAEEIVLARDIMLARLTGGWLHVLHVSTGRGADLVRRAKAEGTRVTAEVMPHHLTMSDAWVGGDRTLLNTGEPPGAPGVPCDPNTKVNPPLRTPEDTRSLLAALRDGTYDVVATDHAPHAEPEKGGSAFADAASGMSGLEVALPLMLALVRAGHLTLADLIEKMSAAPARLLRTPGGTLAPGAPADVTVFDPEERWVVAPERLRTKSANTPLLGMALRGRVRLTLVGGEERYRA